MTQKYTADDLYNIIQTMNPNPADVVLDHTRLKYVLYARQSTHGEGRQERSITDQVADCLDLHVKKNGLKMPDEIREKESAKEPDIRPKFRKMIQDIKSGKYDAILAWHPDRLARNMKDAGEIIYLLDAGILKDIQFATFTFENSPMGKMLLGMSFVLSKQYSDHLRESVMRGQRRSIQEGFYINKPKHGYYKDGVGRLRPDGNNWALIKQAFQMRLHGRTLVEIADFLNAQRYTRAPAKGKKQAVSYNMGKSAVSVFLTDPFYAGVLMHGGNYAKLEELYDFTPILSVDEFLSINKFSDIGAAFKAAQKHRRPSNKSTDFLRGMVLCYACTEPMVPSITTKYPIGKETQRRFYYRCDNKKCVAVNKSERARVVINFVNDFLAQRFIPTREMYAEFKLRFAEVEHKRLKELRSLQITLNNENTGQKNTYDRTKKLMIGDKSLIKHFSSDLEAAEGRQREIECELEKVKEEISKTKEALPTFDEFLKLFEKTAEVIKKTDDIPYKDKLIRQIFSNFTIKHEKVIDFSLKSPYDHLLEWQDFLIGGDAEN